MSSASVLSYFIQKTCIYKIGMKDKDIIIAITDDAACGKTPVMPYVGKSYDGGRFTRLAKHCLSAALLRCGFDTVDCNPQSLPIDMQDLAFGVNRRTADALIVVTYGAFGSGRSFNDRKGFTVNASRGRFETQSRKLGEDICAKLDMHMCGDMTFRGSLSMLGCAAVEVSAGYLTNFDEAKLVYDPDFAVNTAETIARGVCEYFDKPYVRRDDIFCYPLLGTARRGKKVKLLQCLLDANGAAVETDGVFGAATDGAVRRFCACRGRKRDSVVTPEVWRDLLLADKHGISFGDDDNRVLYVRRKLLAKLYPVDESGAFDDKLLSALSSFAADNGTAQPVRGENIDALLPALISIGGGKPRLY